MEDHRYISCIKINGIPILPPVMTEDVRHEMNHYKNLAIALEKKLRSCQVVKNIVDNANQYKVNDENRYNKKLCRTDSIDSDSETDDSLNSDIESVIRDTTSSNSVTIIPTKISTEEKADNVSICDTTEDDTTMSESTIKQDIPDLKTDTNNDHLSRNGIHPTDSAISGSESVTMSTDLNNYLNDTISTKSSTTETTPETRKPQAPKTLDIVPITLHEPMKNKDTDDPLLERISMDSTPKLIRQGSYILDTPSPMLLAHMQLESSEGNYIPDNDYTPTPTTSVTRRKEWNIIQAKTDWETQNKSKEFVIPDPPKTSGDIKRRRSSASCSNQRVCKSMDHKKAESVPSMHHSTRSADCIQAMLAKEYISKNSNKAISHNQRYKSDVYKEKNYSLPGPKANDDISILKLANKLSGSLGSLNIGTQYTKQTEKECNDTFLLNRSFDEKLLRNNVTRHSPSKLKFSITSEKLLTMLRNIQEMHKKQMLELISRQQKEQTLLQQEFERQQMLLLTHIKKSCPELPGMAFPKNTLSHDIERTLTCNENSCDAGDAACQLEYTDCVLRLQEEDKIALHNKHIKMLPCSLNHDDGINRLQFQNNKSCLTAQLSEIDMSDPTLHDNIGNSKCLYMNNNENFRLQESNQYRKQLSVSRQLFPLDGNTTYVPILDRPAYTERHIQAATVISAYAKGYLVRRLMKTDRVIRLKNTYKEALQCMLRLHVDAPLNLPELNFLHRLQLQILEMLTETSSIKLKKEVLKPYYLSREILEILTETSSIKLKKEVLKRYLACDAASMNIVELFAQPPAQRMSIIAHDREIKRSRTERPSSARSYSFATQRTLARKKLKEMGDCEPSGMSRSYTLRSRCQTWASDIREKPSTPHTLYPSIKRSTSAGAVRRPWR